jgi:DNA-binding CsgD family transcriptional regulator
MRPLGLGDELRAALVVGSECWGYLCLHREDGPLGFSRSEVDLIARLGPHLAHALRGAVLLGRRRAPDEMPPGVVLVDDDLNLVGSTPEADHLLSLLADDGGARLPLAVQAVAVALKAWERDGAPPRAMPGARVLALDGRWLDVRASWLRGASGERHVAVVVEPAEKGAVLPILMSAYGLTPRETDVVRLVLRGASSAAISDALCISRHTVQDHLKSIFDKTGVHSRRDLVGLLLGGS